MEHLRDLLSVFATDREAAAVLKEDTGKISLYVNGRAVPPAGFVDKLLRAARPAGAPVTDEVRVVTRTRHLAALETISPVRAEKYRAAYERDALMREVELLEERERVLRQEIAASSRNAHEEIQRLRAGHAAERQRLTEELGHAREQVRALEQRLAETVRLAEQAQQANEADRRQLMRSRDRERSRLNSARQRIVELQAEAGVRERARQAEAERLSATARGRIEALEDELAHTLRALAEAEERADYLLERLLDSQTEIERIRSAEDREAAAAQAVAEALSVVDRAYAQQQAEPDDEPDPPKVLVSVSPTTATSNESDASQGPRPVAAAGPSPGRGAGSARPWAPHNRRKRSPWARRAALYTGRAVILILGLTALAIGLVEAADLRHDTMAPQNASRCAPTGIATARDDCLGRETGHVADMKPGDDATPYRLTITRPSGKTETDLVVDFDLYRAVRSGSAVDLDIWKDHIVKIGAAGKSSRIEHTALPATVRIWLLLTFGTLAALCAVLADKGTPWIWIGICVAPLLAIWTACASTAALGLVEWWAVAISIVFWLPAPAFTAAFLIFNRDS
ncbi:hypothetical protein [Streptomyces sp. A1136]|uniref:hypothetical protein n=1 Tax=Streptomyces sp. A1136 TaxID=2563102 RepID=UPI00109E3D82|nr:hypothetical protein [Streptomyces sp. A1136]THA45647.1 hypothetical protein E6R62_35425 [Streptomyces sp. A1136]